MSAAPADAVGVPPSGSAGGPVMLLWIALGGALGATMLLLRLVRRGTDGPGREAT